ncbi:MAG: hypothetical protein RJA99_4861 [Pseudomonadota bacterium]
MPLPKAPTKPATLLDLTTAVLAKASRPRSRSAATGGSPDGAPASPEGPPPVAEVPAEPVEATGPAAVPGPATTPGPTAAPRPVATPEPVAEAARTRASGVRLCSVVKLSV